jgi:hypothetical protein
LIVDICPDLRYTISMNKARHCRRSSPRHVAQTSYERVLESLLGSQIKEQAAAKKVLANQPRHSTKKRAQTPQARMFRTFVRIKSVGRRNYPNW